MQTPTHTLLALAVLARPEQRGRNRAVLIGSLIPDAFIYAAWLWLTFVSGEPQSRIWNEIYFDAPLQLIGAIFNSAPLYLLLAGAGFLFRRHIAGKLVLAVSLAALIHLAADMPVHAEDAHRHFWPVSNWRFYSPLSYWDGAHHARWASMFEAVMALGCIAVLWQRFPLKWARSVLTLFAVLYAALFIIGL